jgi:uncharacterized repeat protein (TIGR04042 family)
MPEVVLQLCWPDGEASRFYSPSTVIYDFFKPGDTMSIAELEQKGLAVKLKQQVAKYSASQEVRISAFNL